MAQNAIERAEKGDFTEVQRLVALLSNPFNDIPSTSNDTSVSASKDIPPVVATKDGPMCMLPPSSASSSSIINGIYKVEDDQLPPDWAGDICVTCSS
jgi:hypothetical protein